MTHDPDQESIKRKDVSGSPHHPHSYDEIPTDDPVLAEDYALSPSFVKAVIDALESADRVHLHDLIGPLHAADVADLLGLVSAGDRTLLLRELGDALDPEVLTELDDDVRDAVLDEMNPQAIAHALETIDSDDAVQLIEDLPEHERENVLELVSKMAAIRRA